MLLICALVMLRSVDVYSLIIAVVRDMCCVVLCCVVPVEIMNEYPKSEPYVSEKPILS